MLFRVFRVIQMGEKFMRGRNFNSNRMAPLEQNTRYRILPHKQNFCRFPAITSVLPKNCVRPVLVTLTSQMSSFFNKKVYLQRFLPVLVCAKNWGGKLFIRMQISRVVLPRKQLRFKYFILSLPLLHGNKNSYTKTQSSGGTVIYATDRKLCQCQSDTKKVLILKINHDVFWKFEFFTKLSKLIYQQNGVQLKYLIRKTRYAHVPSRFSQAVCLFSFFFPLFYLICFSFSWWSRRQLDGQ